MAIPINSKPNCKCAHCKNDLPFDLPEEIIEATLKGNLVIFAGAGISTETKKIFKETLYEDVLLDLKELKKETKTDLDFPSLMSLYCSTLKNGRQKLLQKIKYRFEYCQQFSELYRGASEFHTELSSIHYIKNIITTNWDDYFERETGAIAITIPEDFAFYDLPDRKVFKIHGSINNYGSVIATKQDYDRCYKALNSGIIGSYLKTILATKTVVFIGYSFKDYDFLKIYSYLKKELKNLIPHIYIVTLDEKIEHENATVIKTNGTFFIASLRMHLEGSNYLISKENIGNIYLAKRLLSIIKIETSKQLEKKKQSNLIYCNFYQDGMKHAFDYLIYHSKSGLSFFAPKLFDSLDAYALLRKDTVKAKNYAEVAYIDGYIEGLKTILYKDEYFKETPYFYIYGIGALCEKKDFDKIIRKKEIYHKQAEIYGNKHFASALKPGADIVINHRPFL
ncbi:MAG: SIR2 family protein [Ferruginibacter sp.]